MSLIQYISRIEFGFGAISVLPNEITRLGINRPLLITDNGIVAAGVLQMVLDAAHPSQPIVYSDTTENPTEACLDACLSIWREHDCDGAIAVGGGSAMDLAKAVALITSHGGNLSDYDIKSGGSARIGPVTPHIAIPTAAGTGAEIGRACVMTLNNGRKCVAVNLNMVASAVIADPELTFTLPPRLTAATGIDALSHGIEAFLSPSFNPPADAIALDGIRRAGRWLRRAVETGDDRTARFEMMMASLQGGMVLQKGLGSAHAMANPLGEENYHHGTLIGILLPRVVSFNDEVAQSKLAEIHTALSISTGTDVAQWLSQLVLDIGLPSRLRELGVDANILPQLAEKAAVDHLSQTNPRSASAADYLALLQAAH